MIKKSLLIALGAACTLCASNAFASPLTSQQALQRVSAAANGKKLLKNGATPSLVYTAVDTQGQPALYIFNRSNDSGVMLLSGDDIAAPILGYTDEGAFDPNNIPPEMAYWMDQYTQEIETARKRNVPRYDSSVSAYPSNWTTIEPLVKTKWNQGAPYNNLTPLSGNSHTPTGCVATAMAQVMKYWNYPEIGTGNISYTQHSQTMTMYFDREPFQWDKMLNNYTAGNYTQEEADAVSYLMKACGYSSEMDYALGGSGTATPKAGMALVNYFKYDGNLKYSERCLFTDSEWTSMVYDQLANIGPVVYDGASPDGGHAFVVDGYDGNGYFHLNWGWGGTCDGYYLLTCLNPSQQGIGGSYGGFNKGQGMIYNIQKPTGQEAAPMKGYMTMMGNLNATSSSNALTFTLSGYNPNMYSNQSLGKVSFAFGMKVEAADGSGTPTYVTCYDPSYDMSVGPGQYFEASRIKPKGRFPSTLPDGKYKVTLVYSRTGTTTWENFQVPIGYFDYIYVTKSGNTYSIESLSNLSLTISDAVISTPLFYNNPCLIEFTVTNNTDMELTQGVRPQLLQDGNVNYEGDTQLISLKPGESAKKALPFNFTRTNSGKVPSTANPQAFQLALYDYNAGTNYGTFGNYTMYRASSQTKVNCTNLEILNNDGITDTDGQEIFGIHNFYNIMLKVGVEVSGNNAFVASPLTAVIYENNPETYNAETMVLEKDFENLIYLSGGDTTECTTSLHFPDFNPSKTYTITIYYLSSNNRVGLASIKFGASSGVEGIVADNGNLNLDLNGNTIAASSDAGISTLQVFDIKGLEVMKKNGAGTLTFISTDNLPAGIYIVRAKDNSGNTRTLKIRK